MLQRGHIYQVCEDHKFWPSRKGVFQFMGEGKSAGVVVLAQPDNGQVMFCVGLKDIVRDEIDIVA